MRQESIDGCNESSNEPPRALSNTLMIDSTPLAEINPIWKRRRDSRLKVILCADSGA